MIARNDEGGKWKLLKKRAGLNELAPERPLSQIAGDRDQMRRDRMDGPDQRRHQARIDTTEMKVGEMHDRTHRLTPEAAALSTPPDTFDSATA